MSNDIQPPAVLLMGAPGSGKTTSLVTYIEAGLDLFVLITEAGGVESLLDAIHARKLPIDKLHYHYIAPSPVGWAALKELEKTITNMNYEDISKMKSGIGKREMNQLGQMIDILSDFPCQRTGKKFGDVTKLGPDAAFAFDSMSGLNDIMRRAHVGYKPTMHQGEWGVVMDSEFTVIKEIVQKRTSHVCMTAHITKEPNEITGIPLISVAALGSKLGPVIPKEFSEFVYAKRMPVQGSNVPFVWSTLDSGADLKNRALPIASNLPPTFKPVVEVHNRRRQQVALSPPVAAITNVEAGAIAKV